MSNVKLRKIYQDLGINYSLASAKKYLRETAGFDDITKTSSRIEVNRAIREVYNAINPVIFQYTLTGSYQTKYTTKGDKNKGILPETKFTNPIQVQTTFFTKTKTKLKPFMRLRVDNSREQLEQMGIVFDLPVADDDDVEQYFKKENALNGFRIAASEYVLKVFGLQENKIRELDADLKNIKMYRPTINLAYKAFNGFRDSGKGECVPETLLHHLQLKGYNKKLTLDKVKEVLNEPYNLDDDCSDEIDDDCPDEIDDDFDDEFNRGYTPRDVIRTLEHFECKGRLLDINLQQFLITEEEPKKYYDVFCGICYDNHLYYCDDRKFLKSLASKIAYFENSMYFDFNTFDKKKEHKKNDKKIEVVECNDLKDFYITIIKETNTLPHIQVSSKGICSIETDDKILCANSEKTIMKEILGNDFINQNTTMLGTFEYEQYFKDLSDNIYSTFSKETFDRLNKHGNIIKKINPPISKVQAYYDINKCRTSCILNNKLGDYEIFNISDEIKLYSGIRRKGYYYIETDDTDLFMRGSNKFYSNEFLLYADKQKIKYKIIYELICSKTIPQDYFKKFIQYIIKKYPNPNHYKSIINKLIGNFGKTNQKTKKGFIETDFNLAVKYFWEHNEDGIGFIDNKDEKENAIWKKMKGDLCTIDKIKISDDDEDDEEKYHYLITKTSYKTLYTNSLPIFNKILENEYIALYELKKKVGGNLISIKTDGIVVDGNYNRIKCGTEIGEIKYEKVYVNYWSENKPKKNESFIIDCSINWNKIYEEEYGIIDFPNGSFCLTGLAGFGKTYFIKSLPEYNQDTTLRLGFTNCSTENLSSEGIICETLNAYFGINFTNGKLCEKKINRLKKVNTIIITEVFMIPSYIMNVLDKIKYAYPDIKFIVEGDPKQLRPVKEENINWLNTKMFNNLCDNNLLILQFNKRNNETENYNKIFNNEKLEDYKYKKREPQNVNICRTNAMRVELNKYIMEKKGGYFIKNTSSNEKAQDIYLQIDTPIMSIKNLKKLNIKNGKMYKIQKITEQNITIENNEFTIKSFLETFVVAYAFTNHKVQGITIKEPYNIYEWNTMKERAKYTAYSRTADGSNVRFIVD
jgi:hypothetical protein